MSDAGDWAAALIALATFAFLLVDRFKGWGRRDARTDDGLKQLGAKIDNMDKAMGDYGRAITANTEMAIRLTGRSDEVERRLGLVESVKDAFVRHAATDVAEHAAMRDSIDRLSRSSELLTAQLSRLTAPAAFAKAAARRREAATSD